MRQREARALERCADAEKEYQDFQEKMNQTQVQQLWNLPCISPVRVQSALIAFLRRMFPRPFIRIDVSMKRSLWFCACQEASGLPDANRRVKRSDPLSLRSPSSPSMGPTGGACCTPYAFSFTRNLS